ncbi:hypothetical protein [Candidatus Nanohalococcus occultus]|uniref:Uncharacterized protein n=1 Tax=Candidatus Nanohalococcus occultus TaxID=2978047 RepID=A0ABY8CEQ1_9ARCH|nr:hypothetical protein SVXNc_0648 [Candidatus Nanohaloarchaeota archaeon SVXNc]
MAAAQNINTPDTGEREQDVYSPRSEADLEQIIDRMEDVENEDVEDAVRQVSEIADENLRGVVRNHFQAPIRSLNNPEENTVELEDGTEAQVVGEEYFVNQNLDGFQDVGNIKWWTLMDEDSYREETRNVRNRDGVNRGLEHLQLDNEGDIHSYRIELDGEPLNPEQTQRLARNLRIRQDNAVFERNQVPRMMLENNNVGEAVRSEDIERREFEEGYEQAREIGLVSENGNLTLKGWLSAVDLEAPDIRSLEDKDDVISFANLEKEHIPGEVEEFTEVGNVNLTFTIPEGRYADEERVGDYDTGATVDRTDRYTEFETEELVEDIVFGTGFGGFSISDIEEGDLRELNSKDVEKVAELMENDPFTEEAFLNSRYEERILDMFEQNNAKAENLEIENAEYRIKTLEELDNWSEYANKGEELGEILSDFGYSTQEELIEDAGWDEELRKIDENFEEAEAKVVEDKDSDIQYIEAVFEDEEESDYRTPTEAKQSVFSSCNHLSLEVEDGELKDETDHEIPISNLIISSYQEELQENEASIVINRNISWRDTKNHSPDEFGKLGSRGVEYDLGSLEQYSDEFQEDIEKMAEEELVDLEEEDGSSYMKTRDKKALEAKAEFEYSVDRIVPNNLEVEASYQRDPNGVASNDALREIGAALDPMNFDSKAYEDIEVETEFEYTEAQQASAI